MNAPYRHRPRPLRRAAKQSLWAEALRDVQQRKSWPGMNGPAGRTSRAGRRYDLPVVTVLMLLVFTATLGWLNRDLVLATQTGNSNVTAAAEVPPDDARTNGANSISFSLCHAGGGHNCVVDGDTFWMNGEKIRIADLDTPETHPPRCAHEAELGERATRRLQQLLNAGPFTLEAAGGRRHDRYGRRLAVVQRDGTSLGRMLIAEGLARAYAGGRRAGWC